MFPMRENKCVHVASTRRVTEMLHLYMAYESMVSYCELHTCAYSQNGKRTLVPMKTFC